MDPELPLSTELASPVDGPQPAEIASSEEPIASGTLPPPQPRWPDKPWLKIWTAPRGTIRAIVDTDPTRYVLLFAVIGGIAESLNRASAQDLGDRWPIVGIVLMALLLGSIGGILSLYISGALFRWTGSLLGGQASSEQVRSALAWSLLPRIAAMVLWIPYLVLYGEEMFTTNAPRMASRPELLIVLGAIELVLGIWALFLMIKTVAEVHQFSAWRALVTLAIPLLVLVGLGFGCGLALVMSAGGM